MRLDLGMRPFQLERMFRAADGIDGRTKYAFLVGVLVQLAAILKNLRQLGLAVELIEQEYAASSGQPQTGRDFRRVGLFFFPLLAFLGSLHVHVQFAGAEVRFVFLGGFPIDQ